MNNQIFLQGITIEQLAQVLKSMLAVNPQEQTELANPLLTRDEVCKLLSFNKTSLWKHTKSGRLKSYGIGNRVYYKRDEVLAAVKPINS